MGQVFALRDFKPYTPVLDPRRDPSPGIMDGRNFYTDVDGPVSAFGARFFDWRLWDSVTAQSIRELQVNGEFWYGTPTGVWRIDPVSLLPELMIDVVSAKPFWPWTSAQIGGYWYFTQYNVGLWQYNPLTNTVAQITTPFGIIKGLCASYGRLVVIDDANVGWSALDDGTNFTPSTLTGAGAQSLAILSKTAYRVDPIVDGVVISTDLGFIKGQRVDATYVYSWLVLSTEIRIFSPNMGIYVPDFGYLTLSSAGLHLTNVRTNYFSPQASQPYEPAMSEYLRRNYVEIADRTKDAVISLYYSAAMRMVFVAIAPNSAQGQYTTTFCFYLPSGKWGRFDHVHSGIVDFTLQPTLEVVAGYMSSGYFKWFDSVQFDEVLPSAPDSIDEHVWRVPHDPALMKKVNLAGQVTYRAVSSFMMGNKNPTKYSNVTATGIYAINSTLDNDENLGPSIDIPTMPDGTGKWVCQSNIDVFMQGQVRAFAYGFAMPQQNLASWLQLGPFRATEAKEADETSMISSLLIGTTLANVGGSSSEDYNFETPDTTEDYNGENPDSWEDYGGSGETANVFTLAALATDDGITPQIQGWETLYPSDSIGSETEYSTDGYSAIMHVLQISTVNPGDSYAVKTLDISMMPTGRHF